MSRISRNFMWTAVAMAMVSLTAMSRAAGPAVVALDQVSAEADIVISVPNLAEASRRFAAWSQAAGIPSPEMQNALGNFKQEMGLEAGLNDNGAMILVIQNLATALEQDTEPDVIMLMPVTDYDAFVANFGGQSGATTPLTMPDGQPGFAKQLGDFAVMAETQALVEGYTPANNGGQIVASLGANGAEVLDASDGFMYMNFEKSGPQLITMIEEAVAQIENEMQGLAPGAGMEQGLKMYASAAKTAIEGSSAMVVGMDVDENGLGFHKVVKMKPNSALAEFFPGGESTAASQLAKLPTNPYIFAMAIDAKALNLVKLNESIMQAMGPQFKEQMGAAYDQAIELGKNVDSMSMVFYAPDQMAMMSGSVMNMLAVIETADSGAYVQTLRDYMANLNGVSVPVDPSQPEGPAITYQTNYTPNALQLEGVSVDQFQLQTVMPPEMMQQMGPAAGFVNMFTSYRGYVASKDNQVLISTSADPQSVTNALKVVADGSGIGSGGAIADQRQNILTQNPAMEMYLSLGGIADMANLFVGMMGMPPIEVPADLPPVAMSMSADGDAMSGRMYVPSSSVRFIIDTAMEMQAGMGGGPGGGAPGGPAPY